VDGPALYTNPWEVRLPCVEDDAPVAGQHTRSAVGVAELPFDIAVEIEFVAELAR
jgi:enamine deaminase RidA (YjgF/YER057c/UK114 family)